MKTIHELPDSLVAKIAAGEVIERPVYAVKELIENAVDAKATIITINILHAGLKKIIITDNGIGMSKEDILECFKPHTTSKLLKEDDLSSIKSLGFRGEALSSIAAVSTLTIKSRTTSETVGTMIQIQNGKAQKPIPTGMPQGTSISCEQLFANVPGRKKFLKSPQTEFRHITELITHFALAHPEIRFTLIHNKRTVIYTSQTDTLTSRLQSLLGASISSILLPLSYAESYITITGFIAKPQVTTKYQSKQFLFVNSRSVSDKLISLAVKEAFGNLLEQQSYPVFILFVSLPYEVVDVNVHPRKEQISFINSKMVFEAVYKAVSETLKTNNITFHNLSFENGFSIKGSTNTFAAELIKQTVSPWSVNEAVDQKANFHQLNNTYLITQTKNSLVLIDQHAAHERILYEQFKKAFNNQRKQKEVMILKEPLVLNLPALDTELLVEHFSEIKKLGFMAVIQKSKVVISQIPLLLKDRPIETFLQELLEELKTKGSVSIDKKSNKMLTFLACRSAIMAGETVTNEQAQRLIQKLEKTHNNATCPHGRPTRIIIDIQMLNKLFKRT